MNLNTIEIQSVPLKTIITPQVITVAPEEKLEVVLKRMQSNSVSCIVAVDECYRPVGIFTEQDAIHLMAKERSVANLLMSDVMSQPVRTVPPNMGYAKAYQLMAEHKLRHLIVVDDKGFLLGLVSEGDFLHHMGMEYLVELKTVGGSMTTKVSMLDAQLPLSHAIDLMDTTRLSCLVATSDGKPVGILTERDVVRLAVQGVNAEAEPLHSHMSAPLETVSPDLPLQIASRVMESRKIRRLVVVHENGSLAGILTRHDIAKSLQSSYIEYLQETLDRKSRDLLSSEKRLQEIEQREFYQDLVDQVSDAIYVIDADDSRILDANLQASKNLGMTHSELLELRAIDISGKLSSLDFWVNKHVPLLRSEGEQLIVSTHRRADGSTFPVEVKARLVVFGGKEYVVAVARDLSERMAATQKLVESERRLQSLFENAPLPYQSLDMEGNILTVNKAWVELTGRDSSEVIGTNISEYLTGDSQKLLEREFPVFKQHGEINGPLFELRLPDGGHRLVQVNGQISHDEAHNESQTHCILSDVTERDRAEAVLRESEQRFRMLFDQSPISMAYVGFNGELISLNKCFTEVFGYTAEDIPSLDEWLRKAHPDDDYRQQVHNRWLALVEDAREGDHRIQANEYMVICKQQTQKFVRASGVTTDQGFLAILEDVTEQQRASAALKESAETYFGIITTSQDGFWVLDGQGNLLDVNETYIQMSGYSREELMGMRVGDLDAVETPEDTRERIKEIQHKGGQLFQTRHRRKNGEIYDVEVHATYWTGSGERFFVFLRDITERIKAENQLRQAAVVFSSTNEGVMITDAEGRIRMINDAFCKLTGYSEEQVLGQPAKILQSGRHDEKFYQEMWESISESGSWQGEIWNRRMDGSTMPEWLSISSVKNENGDISHYVGVFSDITQLKESEQKLNYLAHHDTLTDLPNRLMLKVRLEQAFAIAKRNGTSMALLLLDLDRFKDVNDSFGHAAGDELLQKVASLLKENLREVDLVCRMGGDEFAILLEDIFHPEDAGKVADNITRLLAKSWELSNGCEVFIGGSVGISIFPEQCEDAQALLQHADAALYRAKAEGRGRFQYFSEELTHDARKRLDLEARLTRAIANNELEVYYQPQIHLESGKLVGAEALVRWNDPLNGLIGPNDFIPLAEQTGLINDIGLFVLRKGATQLKEWIDQGYKPFSIAVNLSAVQLRHSNIKHTIADVLTETGLNPEYLELEITESALMEREDESIDILESLRALGVRIAIDDFGTGYSSLAYLKKFPLDVLKIDKSFVDDIPADRDDMVIASTIVAMGHSLGLQVLAEGVETEEQLEFLRSKNCHYYQGYLRSRPVPAQEFSAFLTYQE